MTEMARKWNQFWCASYPTKGLAIFRILLCLLLLKHLYHTEMVGLIRMDEAEDYFAAGFYSPYFSWLLPPSYEVFIWIGRACFLFASFALIGFLTQISLFAAGVVFLYLFLLNKFFYYNHLYSLILAVFLASLAPVGRAFSVDAVFARLRGKPRQNVSVSWSLRMMQVIVSVIYLGSAISKTNIPWLSGDAMKTFYEFGHTLSKDGAYVPPEWLGFLTSIPFSAQALGSLAVEYFLAFGLWIRNLRPWALVLGILFHLYIQITMEVSTFSWQMIVYYLLFLMNFKFARRVLE